MQIAVIVATHHRINEIHQLIPHLLTQSEVPSNIIISAVEEADVPSDLTSPVQVIFGTPGSCAQRNRAIELVLSDVDVIVFFDDDFLPSRNAIAGIRKLFEADESLVGCTGLVLADGVVRGGLIYDSALEILAAYDRSPMSKPTQRPTRRAYGCNMAFRASRIGDVRFDERLPLYGWLEDTDFAERMSRVGRLAVTNAFAGVHLGVRKGRTPGLRLGYSQVANPVYLFRKGTMSFRSAAWFVSKAFLVNHLKSLVPERYIDRSGRARGNRFALRHLLTGRLAPERVLDIEA